MLTLEKYYNLNTKGLKMNIEGYCIESFQIFIFSLLVLGNGLSHFFVAFYQNLN